MPATTAYEPSPPELSRFKARLGELQHLTVTWPRPGQDRIRKIVHRGARRPTLKYRSVTMQRTFHVESTLEQEALWRLDACPQVTFIAEQPMRIAYDHAGMRAHIPDFIAYVGGVWEVIEIKRQSTLTNEDMERTAWFTTELAPVARYRLLTENELQQCDLSANCRSLLQRGRNIPDADWQERAVAGVSRKQRVCLRDYGWDTTHSEEAEWIAWLILNGRLVADLTAPLTSSTVVRPRTSTDGTGVRLWPA